MVSATTLVTFVPDEATLVLGVLAHQVPILLEATLRVAHGVGIFALNEGLGVFRILGIVFAAGIVHVHGTVDVGLAVVAAAFNRFEARLNFGDHTAGCISEAGVCTCSNDHILYGICCTLFSGFSGVVCSSFAGFAVRDLRVRFGFSSATFTDA